MYICIAGEWTKGDPSNPILIPTVYKQLRGVRMIPEEGSTNVGSTRVYSWHRMMLQVCHMVSCP